MHQSMHGFGPCVQPEGTCIGMSPSRREPMKTIPQAAEVRYVIADACQTIFPSQTILCTPHSGRTWSTAMLREGQQREIELEARQHQALIHSAEGMQVLVGASWLTQALPSLRLWGRISLQVLSKLWAALPVVS